MFLFLLVPDCNFLWNIFPGDNFPVYYQSLKYLPCIYYSWKLCSSELFSCVLQPFVENTKIISILWKFKVSTIKKKKTELILSKSKVSKLKFISKIIKLHFIVKSIDHSSLPSDSKILKMHYDLWLNYSLKY